jgi:hypothetical protein
MKITNDIFQIIYQNFAMNIDTLYKEESACLLVFRILPELSQQLIMRIIHVHSELNYNYKERTDEINWSDIIDNNANDIKHYIRLLTQIKIIPSKELLELHPDFKRNLLKIISVGLTPIPMVKKKIKDWNETFNYGIEALEKYLKKLFAFEKPQFIENENPAIKFLLNIKFLKKENSYKATSQALITLLGDKQFQIRHLIGKYIINYKNACESDESKNMTTFLTFLTFLFSLCTLGVGIVSKYILIL